MSRKEDKACFSSFDLPPLILQPFKSCVLEATGRIWAFFNARKGMKKRSQVT